MLWCYTRNPAFKTEKVDYHVSADLTGQANHLGVTIQADIIKQKLPENNGGYNALKFGKTDKHVYTELTPGDHPIELTRYQVANCYMGRIGLINSGGASGANDFADAVRTAVINKRAGGMGLISGRKAFQRPMAEGVADPESRFRTCTSTRRSRSPDETRGMSILKVARMGHPVLRQKARALDPTEVRTAGFQKLIDDMIETMVEYEGIGLAAPQVHEPVRIFVAGIDGWRRPARSCRSSTR